MDEATAAAARGRGGVVALRELAPSETALVERRVGTRDLRRTGRRTAVSATSPLSDDQRLWVAQLEVGEPMAFTGQTAAAILGFPRVDHPTVVAAMIPRTRRIAAVPGVSLTHAAAGDLVGVRVVDGHPVTSIEVTLRELARRLPLHRAVSAVQDQLRLRTTTESRLRAVLGRGRSGAAMLRAALDVAGDGAHSRAERRLDAALRAAGAPAYRRQVALRSSTGAGYWLDVLFDEARIGVEVMGPHHLDPEQFEYDCRRANAILGEHGIRLLRYPAATVCRDAAAVATDILRVSRVRRCRT